MRKIFVLQIILILCAGRIAYAAVPVGFPDGFSHLQVEDYEIIGYGDGDTREEASAKARDEIARSIQIQVNRETLYETKLNNDVLSQKKEVVSKQKSDVVLTELETIKQEQKDKKWYVAMKYENLPIEKKFARRLQHCANEKQNRYLRQTQLIKDINRELKCSPNIRVVRNNGIWYLTSDKVVLPLTNREFDKLLNNSASDVMNFQPSGDVLMEGSVLTFTISAKQDGFVSLLDVYENGEVFIISPNQPIKANKKLALPDPAGVQELVCGLITPGKQASDLYVAVYSKNKIDLSRIQQVGKKVEKDEEHFKFDELLGILDENEFSSVLIRTKPKSE